MLAFVFFCFLMRLMTIFLRMARFSGALSFLILLASSLNVTSRT